MGISFSGLISGREIEIESLAGRTIAIDAFNTMYQFISIIRDRMTGEPLRDSKGRVTSHLSGLLYRSAKMIEVGITPVYVFDGKPPEFKARVVAERMKIREAAEEKWKAALEAGETEKVRLYAQAASRLTGEMIDDAKKLLHAMGVACVQAPSEGEAQATELLKDGLVWAVGSQDWDSLLFGAEKLVRNLTITGKRKIPRKEKWIDVEPELVELRIVLHGLGITHDQLICLGILIGTDYNPGGVKGIGPKTALKIVKEKKTLSEIFSGLEWPFETTAQQIFDFFKHPPVEKAKIETPKFEPEKVLKIMVEEHDFSEERMKKVVDALIENIKSKRQSGLGKWF